MTTESQNKLEELRSEIDKIDEYLIRLLAKRFSVVKEIGKIKKRAKMEVENLDRWAKVLSKIESLSQEHGLNYEFTKEVWDKIHEESKKLERDIKN